MSSRKSDGPNRADQLKELTYPSDPHTAVKHAIYKRYTQCWMGKVLQRFPRGAIVDAFAGAGRYTDGLDGSPVMLAKTFLEHSHRARFNQLRLLCADIRQDRIDYLTKLLATLPQDSALSIELVPGAEFISAQSNLHSSSHKESSKTPTLWILDPYNWNSVSMAMAKRCLLSPKDEILVTLFTAELHRFCSDPAKHNAIDRYLGNASWRTLLPITDQFDRTQRFADSYASTLQDCGYLTGTFSIDRWTNTPRYHLVFATHDKAGLECWNKAVWYLDSYTGSGASPQTIVQNSLFDDTPDLTKLEASLRALSGKEQSFTQLSDMANRLHYKENHLREVLDRLGRTGAAVRIDTDSTRTAWPKSSVIRFYNH